MISNTTANQTCTVFQNGEWKRGEYTGFSHITKKHHFSLYNGDTLQLASLIGVKFDIPPTQSTIYETGATSHAVNDLILWTENTNELAQLRDKVYIKYVYSGRPNTGAMKRDFINSLLYKAMNSYLDKFPGHEDHKHIEKMTIAEQDEYAQIYVNGFKDWKEEKQRNP